MIRLLGKGDCHAYDIEATRDAPWLVLRNALDDSKTIEEATARR